MDKTIFSYKARNHWFYFFIFYCLHYYKQQQAIPRYFWSHGWSPLDVDLVFFCMMEQNTMYFHLMVQGPSECQEHEGCRSLCQASKWRNMTWRNWSWQAGKEKSLQPYLPCPVLLAGVGWRTESPSGGWFVLQPSPQSQVTAIEALLVSLVSTLLYRSIWATRADSPAVFSLLPV